MSKDGININSAPINFTRPLKPPGTPKSLKAVSKWLKLSDLPNDFWGECFVGTKDGVVDIKTVKILDGAYPVWYSEHLTRWFEFNSKVSFRIMPIEMPKITKEDFK